MKTAVVGIGGLGHLAVQFLAAFGCEVTAISTTHSKDDEARKLGATRLHRHQGDRRAEEGGRLVRLHHLDRLGRPALGRVRRRAPAPGAAGAGRHPGVGRSRSRRSRCCPRGRSAEPSAAARPTPPRCSNSPPGRGSGRSSSRSRWPRSTRPLDHVRAGKARYRVVLEA